MVLQHNLFDIFLSTLEKGVSDSGFKKGLGILIKKLKLTPLCVMFPKQHNKKPHLIQFNTV